MNKIAVFIITIFFISSNVFAYETKTHGKSTQEGTRLVEKTDTAGLYRELYDQGYARQMVMGSESGDFGNVAGNNRSFRHFYDPNAQTPKKGIKYHDYYQLWAYIDVIKNLAWVGGNKWAENLEVTAPASGYYDDALEWARNSAGFADMMNWEGALKAYDYSESARAQAYHRLGYVTHLVSDMAQPDHVLNYPHPGSGFRYPPDDSDLLNVGTVYYGFEGLIENYINVIDFPGMQPKKMLNLDDYFNEMVKISQKAVKGKFILPMGLKLESFSFDMYKIPGLIKGGSASAQSMARLYEMHDVAIMPAIDDNKPEERNRHLNLAKELLKQASDFNAGLVELFYDIVNVPPYVAEVSITQDGTQLYKGWCEEIYDDVKETLAGVQFIATYQRLSVRHLYKNEYPIKAGKEALIKIAFGPGTDAAQEIDPASVKVMIGDMEVPGAMTSSRIWEGVFIFDNFKEKEKKLPIKISAKDIHNHFPRPGLPEKGYELDSNPETPAKLAQYASPYAWKNYEPGQDINHTLVIKRTSSPPIAQEVKVFSDDRDFLNAKWIVSNKDKSQAFLENATGIKQAGVDINRDSGLRVRVKFSEIMDDNSLRLKFGPLDIQMAPTEEDRVYECIVPLLELGKAELDEVYTLEIEGRSRFDLLLDGNPKTVTLQGKDGRWLGYDEMPDRSHKLRIYGKLAKPVLKGRVHEMVRVTPDQPWHIGKPLSKWNVILYTTYIEITDKSIAQRFAKLVRSARSVQNKRAKGITEVTQEEYNDCRELMEIKGKVKTSAKAKAGSKPGWITKTDSNGKFTFPLYNISGEEGIIDSYYVVYTFPPEGVLSEEGRDTVSSAVSCDILHNWDSLHDWRKYLKLAMPAKYLSDAVQGISVNTTASLALLVPEEKEKLLSIITQYEKLKEEIKGAQNERAQMDEEFKKYQDYPVNIEKTWQERAVKLQREFETGFKQAHGESSGWNDETRSLYQEQMYKIPNDAKKAWENEKAAFDEERRKAQEKISRSVAALEEKRPGLIEIEDEFVNAWKDAQYDIVVEIPIWEFMPGGKRPASVSEYQINGTISGEEITPELRRGYFTEALLIKLGVDDLSAKSNFIALSLDNGSRGISGDLTKPKTYQPPYRFKFTEKISEHLVIYKYIRYERPYPSDDQGIPIGVSDIRPVLTPFGMKEFIINRIDGLWMNFQIPADITINGKPPGVKDTEKFKRLMDERLELMRKMGAMWKEYQDKHGVGFKNTAAIEDFQKKTEPYSKRLMDIEKELKALKE